MESCTRSATKKEISSPTAGAKSRTHLSIVTNQQGARDMDVDHKPNDLIGCLMDNARVRIFTSILMRAWRNRRQEVKDLKQKLDGLRKWAVKAENKIHIYNTLYSVERKRNESLEAHLKEALEHMGRVRNTCESLTATVIGLKADKAALEQQLRTKHREFDALSSILGQAKSDLFRSLEAHQHLQKAMSQERKNAALLDSEKKKLLEEICQLGLNARHVEEEFRLEIAQKSEQLQLSRKRVGELESRVEELNQQELLLQVARDNDTRLRQEIETLRQQVVELRGALDQSIVAKLQLVWKSILGYQRKTITMAHLFAFYLLPATPPPSKDTI